MSAKTSTQPGRRTPLSLSGTVTKSQPNKGSNNITNGGGNNPSSHQSSNNNKQDNKLQQQKNDQVAVNTSETKENPNKRQQSQIDKKQLQSDNKKSNEKSQNGVNNNRQQQSNENKQQLQNKEKQQQNGSGDSKVNEKDKKEKTEKSDKLDKPKETPEDTKSKEEKPVCQSITDNKKEEKKHKEVKDSKEDKKEGYNKSEVKIEEQNKDDKKSKVECQVKNDEMKSDEKVENMEIVEEQKPQQKASTEPVTPKSNNKANKTSIPGVNKTPTKIDENTPQKSTPSNATKAIHITKREVTTTIDEIDIEMEPLAVESSPMKSSQPEEVGNIKISPAATSTPGKMLLPKRNAIQKSDVQLAMQTALSPERPRVLSQISGRKSIRPISDYTPSKFQSNLQFRESYRRINTELDVTNTSMNVTVGSEVPSNLSFSFFGRGRKRERTPPIIHHSQSAIGELQTDIDISPPKKARLDMHGFFSVVASPLSLLRNRFSKASLQSSTPLKLEQKINAAEDEIEVQNVSGLSLHEEISTSDKEPETNTTIIDHNNASLGEEAKEMKLKTDVPIHTSAEPNSEGKESKEFLCGKTCGRDQTCDQSDIKITETPLQCSIGDPMAKNKRCAVM